MRPHRATSKDAHDSIKGQKAIMYERILQGLEKLKVGGTFEQIAEAAGLKDKQVWKRLSEMSDKIYNTGITRKLSSGRKGLVWQLRELEKKEGEVPVIEKPKKKKETQQVYNPLFA